MATVTAYANGVTAGIGNPTPVGGMRGNVRGWSAASVRRHKRWLYSVDSTGLDGFGYGVTLTVRDTPGSHSEWARLVEQWCRSLYDAGALRWHWVVEWQRRKTPHLHAAVYLPDRSEWAGWDLAGRWLTRAEAFGAGPAGQVVKPLDGPVGWLQYLSKHAARGVAHYQRQGMPPGWEKSGRLWGKGGSWPVEEPLRLDFTGNEYYRFRRLIRAWATAEARSRADWRAVGRLRRMLACDDPMLSRVRGVSEWAGLDLTLRMAQAAGWQGEMVQEAADL